MLVEAIDTVLKIWESEAPYNIEGKYWTVSTEKTMIPEVGQGTILKPLQQPHPPIIVTAVAPFSKGRHRGGGAGLGSDHREFPAAAMGEDPLAELCRGMRAGRASGQARKLARGEVDLRRR